MTTTPAPALADAEQDRIAAFDAAPYPPEVAEAALVETVAQAMHRRVCNCGQGATNIDRDMAAAAIAAYRAAQDGGAEEAGRRVEAQEGVDYPRDAAADRPPRRAPAGVLGAGPGLPRGWHPVTAVDVAALEAARAAALTIRREYPSLPTLHQCGYSVVARWSDGAESNWVDDVYTHADAALIVAAVNALPDLLAAVRERDALRAAVEGLADDLEVNYKRTKFDDGALLATDLLRALLAAVDGGGQ